MGERASMPHRINQKFVGAGLDPTTVLKGMKPIRVNVVNAPLKISPDTLKSGLTPPPTYDRSTGILTVTLNLSAFANDFTSAVKALCVPQLFCQLSGSKCRQGWRLRQSDPGRAPSHRRLRRVFGYASGGLCGQ
jgi:hypothetical protein